jgi:hypothetical protein
LSVVSCQWLVVGGWWLVKWGVALWRIVTRLPLERLWDDVGHIAAQRERFLSKSVLRDMLRQHPVEFYMADLGQPLRRVDVARCYEFWKSEAADHVVDDPESGFHLDSFSGHYALVASEWSGDVETPIVLLEKFH